MRKRRLFPLLLAAASTLLALVGAELSLRLWASRPSPPPSIPDYGDTWRTDGLGPGGYLKPNLDLEVRDGQGGTVPFVTESHGFRRRTDVARRPSSGTFRLLVLGDSFVAGYRVGQEETFTHLLEAGSGEHPGIARLEALPAVIEEPVTGLHYLDRHGLAFHPDAVLLGLTLGNDIVQTWANLEPEGAHRWATRDDGSPGARVIPNPQARPDALARRARRLELPSRCFDPRRARAADRRSWLDALAARSHLARRLRDLLAARSRTAGPQPVVSTWGEYRRPRLLDSNGLGVCLVAPPAEIETAFRRLEAVLAGYRDLARAHGVELVVASFPQRYAVQPEDWQATVEAYGLIPDCFDPAAPGRRLARMCRRLDLPCADPTETLRETHRRRGESLYLPGGDMHWNALGHRAFAEAIGPVIRRVEKAWRRAGERSTTEGAADRLATRPEPETGPEPEPEQP